MSKLRAMEGNAEAIDHVKRSELPASWSWESLQSLVDKSRPICYGILMPKENLKEGVPFVKVRDFKGDRIDVQSLHRTSHTTANAYRRSSLLPGDLLLSIRGTFGRVATVPAELVGGNITQDTARVAVVSSVDADFVAYWLRSPDCQNYFKRVARGVAVRGVNIGDIKPCPCPVAPFREQRRVVEKIEELFSDLDAGMAALQRARANLQRYRASVLAAAVAGRLTADWRAKHPDAEPASELLGRILAERRRRWEADQLVKFAAKGKEPPKGWQAKYVEPARPNAVDLPRLPKHWTRATIEQLSSGDRPISYGVLQPGSECIDGVPLVLCHNLIFG